MRLCTIEIVFRLCAGKSVTFVEYILSIVRARECNVSPCWHAGSVYVGVVGTADGLDVGTAVGEQTAHVFGQFARRVDPYLPMSYAL